MELNKIKLYKDFIVFNGDDHYDSDYVTYNIINMIRVNAINSIFIDNDKIIIYTNDKEADYFYSSHIKDYEKLAIDWETASRKASVFYEKSMDLYKDLNRDYEPIAKKYRKAKELEYELSNQEEKKSLQESIDASKQMELIKTQMREDLMLNFKNLQKILVGDIKDVPKCGS